MKLFPLHILPNDTNIDFMRWRHAALVRGPAAVRRFDRADRHQGLQLRAGLHRRHGGRGPLRAKPCDVEDVRAKLEAQRLRRCPGAELRRRHRPADPPAAAGRARTGHRQFGQDQRTAAAVVKAIARWRQPGHDAAQRVRRPAGRQGPGDERPVRHAVRAGRLPDLHRVPLRVEVRDRGEHHHPARPAGDGGLHLAPPAASST